MGQGCTWPKCTLPQTPGHYHHTVGKMEDKESWGQGTSPPSFWVPRTSELPAQQILNLLFLVHPPEGRLCHSPLCPPLRFSWLQARTCVEKGLYGVEWTLAGKRGMLHYKPWAGATLCTIMFHLRTGKEAPIQNCQTWIWPPRSLWR